MTLCLFGTALGVACELLDIWFLYRARGPAAYWAYRNAMRVVRNVMGGAILGAVAGLLADMISQIARRRGYHVWELAALRLMITIASVLVVALWLWCRAVN